MKNGKPMRRILRKGAEEKIEELGGTSTDSKASEERKRIDGSYFIIPDILGEGGKS